jgi:peroxiredoxin
VSTPSFEQLPGSLPVPRDDGAAAHLPGEPLPPVILQATSGGTVSLAGLGQIPGARGCTPETIGFRDHYGELADLGAEILGLSSQSPAEQAEAAARLAVPFPLLSDSGLALASQLGLPTFTASDGVVRYKRLTLVVSNGRIEHVFYPVFPPDKHAQEVVAWLRG